MEPLRDGQQELDHRFNRADGLEVRFIWDSIIEQAYSQVEDHNTGEQFNAIAPDGVHPKETFAHPFMYRIVEVEVLDGRGTE